MQCIAVYPLYHQIISLTSTIHLFLNLPIPFPPSPSLSPSLSVASGEAVTDMATVASDLFHVVNGAFTMKKMCEQSMNQSLHDGTIQGDQRVSVLRCYL